VLDELSLMSSLAQGITSPKGRRLDSGRDPVCGMAVTDPDALSIMHGGNRYVSCSKSCQARFVRAPEHFAGS
jgi:YHS domain-containing protein